jgi:uncharacterized protein (TIGR03085 family)
MNKISWVNHSPTPRAYREGMSVAQRERAALIEILRALGPDAPTLCEGWTTRDLTAHLVVRERRPDAVPGLVFGPLASYTARLQNQLTTSTKWEDLVELFASGPPVLSPFQFLDPVASIHEFFVHHEDVRRAQTSWEPRELDTRTTEAVKRRVAMVSWAGMSKSMAAVAARLTLRTPDGQTVVAVGNGSPVTVTGGPLELLLFAFGRNAARVDFGGDDEVVAAVQAAKRGF